MDCKYSKREPKDKSNRSYIYCKPQGCRCHAIRFCPVIQDIINIDNYKDCVVYLENEKGDPFMNKVILEKDGFLYIELNDEYGQAVVIENPFEPEDIPSHVNLVKVGDTYYIKGYAPKITTKKR